MNVQWEGLLKQSKGLSSSIVAPTGTRYQISR